MALPKIMGTAAADVMKVNDGNDSLDMFIRQAIGKEPFLSFSRANDSPVQWIQLLHALDQQDLPGWPFLSPLKIQMQKCDKCSREYCSTINYRRHIRLHRRNLNLDKDSTTKNRGLLLAFWDKLSPEEAMEIMSFNDVSLEGVNGTSIVKALTSFIRRPGFTSLPQSYVRSGSAVLDIIQGRPSRFPISSQELFSILDDASEGTFLLAGTAESLQKFVFDGEAGRIGLEMRNLVACTSFLIEQKLVKACLADKDAEALRYHNLLVEEEEAAQKRHAAILEKKKQKKLRQKEHKTKGQAGAERYDSPEDTSPSRTSSPGDADSVLEVLEVLQNPTPPEPVQIMDVEDYNDKRHGDGDSGLGTSQIVYHDFISYQNVGHRALRRSGRRSVVNTHRQAPKLHRTSNGFHTNHNNHAQKFGNMKKHASSRESCTAAANGVKVWTPKPKSDTDDESYKTRMQIEPVNLPDQDKKHEVLIGSISVKLGNCSNPQHDENFGRSQESSALEIHEMAVKTEAMQSSANRPTVMQWKPVSRYDNGGQVPVQVGGGECKVGSIPCNGSNEVQQTTELETRSNHREESPISMENEAHRTLKFSSHMAEAFLAKRWKEAVASDHVKLVLYPEARPSGCPEAHGNNQEAVPYFTLGKRGILQSAENRLENYKTLEHSVAAKSKTRANKPDKGSKVKYIPKQGSG